MSAVSVQKKSRSEGQRRTSNARTVATSPELSKSCEQDKNKNKNKKEIVPQTTTENKNKSKIEPKHNKQNKHLCNHTLRRLSTVLCARSTEPVHARLQRADDARHAMHRPPPPRAARASRPSLRDQPLHRAAATLSIVCRSQTNKTNKQKERRLEIQTMQLKKIDISEEKKQAGKDEHRARSVENGNGQRRAKRWQRHVAIPSRQVHHPLARPQAQPNRLTSSNDVF